MTNNKTAEEYYDQTHNLSLSRFNIVKMLNEFADVKTSELQQQLADKEKEVAEEKRKAKQEIYNTDTVLKELDARDLLLKEAMEALHDMLLYHGDDGKSSNKAREVLGKDTTNG